MSTPRRDFIRAMTLGGSALATGLPVFAAAPTEESLAHSAQIGSSTNRHRGYWYAGI